MRILFFALLLSLHTSLYAAANTPDLSGSSSKGLQVEIYSELSPLAINHIHSWNIRILDSEQRPVDIEQLSVTGGMPEHDHGLPTQPQVTEKMDNGDHLLEGVRFHMPGKWELVIRFTRAGVEDQALIEFQL